MGNILIVFRLAITKKKVAKEVMQKKMQESVSLKGQMLQLQKANCQDIQTIQHLQMELQNLEDTRKRVLELETKNSNYWNELPNLHKHVIEIGKMLGTIDLKQAKFKQALEEEQANQKAMEQSLTLIKSYLFSPKGRVVQLEEQNETLIETMQKQQMEL